MPATLITMVEPKGPRPDISKFDGFDHLTLWVGNAKQAATFYCTRFGFQEIAYRGLETNDREYCSRVLRQDRIYLVLKSPLNPGEIELNSHIAKHGDGVRDVAFRVDDAVNVFNVNIWRFISNCISFSSIVCYAEWSSGCSGALD